MEATELTRRREALGLSINGLAQEFRCAPSSVLRWEAGTIALQGLVAIGADTVLRRLERTSRQQRQPASPPAPAAAPATRRAATATPPSSAGLAFALTQAERCQRSDDLEGAARWEQIAAGIAASIARPEEAVQR
jgi:hypothetical protein